MNWNFLRNVALKSLGLLVLLNIIFAIWFPLETAGRVSLYNSLYPGRERFPFGENPGKSYNLSLYNLDAMFASHRVAEASKKPDEFRVFIIGDSSVWGTLLRPAETLSGQLNQLQLVASDGRKMEFYNLGYPTVSLIKDVLILEKAMQYQPDMIIWLVTLEAFPWDKQFTSPLVENNLKVVLHSAKSHGTTFPLQPQAMDFSSNLWRRTIFLQRRSLADLVRLQVYGVMWAATGIDQEYFDNFPPAQRDFEDDELDFHGIAPGQMDQSDLAFQALDLGVKVAGSTPIIVVNEPMLISTGENSDLRYNYFYPRWVYDQYREWVLKASENSDWQYLDEWDLVPQNEFTNSAIHLNPAGSQIFAEALAKDLVINKR